MSSASASDNIKHIKKINKNTAITLAVATHNVSSNYYNGNGVFFDGSISVLASGGKVPYKYTLVGHYDNNNGYFPTLRAGTYEVDVIDANGEIASTTVVLSAIYPVPGVSLINVVPPTGCNTADGSFSLSPAGGTPPYDYSIDGGVTFTSANTFTGLTKGVYICLLKDANGMLAEVETSPAKFPNTVYFNCDCCTFTVYSSGNGVSSCTDNKGYLAANGQGGSLPITYSIDGINYFAAIPNNSFPSEGYYIFYDLAPGLYTLYAKDNKGSVTKTTTGITKYCNISIVYVGVEATCEQSDGSLTVHATNGVKPYSFTMDGVNFQPDSVFTGLASGSYGISVKDADGVINSIIATVYDKCPEVAAIATNENCSQRDGSITATGTKGTLPYQFSIDGSNFQAGNVFSGLAAGDYTLTIKDANGFTKPVTVSIQNNCLAISLSAVNTVCTNSAGMITVTGSGGTGNYTYSLDGIHFQGSNVFNNLPPGDYTVTLQDGSLSKTRGIIITDMPGPKITVDVMQASCKNTNGMLVINPTGGTAPLQYSIDAGVTMHTGNVYDALDSGRYIVFVQDANKCNVRDTITLTALPTPFFSLGSDTSLCEGEKYIIQAPFNPNYLYQWQDNTVADNDIADNPGKFYVRVTNQYNCTASDTINIAYRPLPVFSLGNDTVLCSGKVLLEKPQLPNGTYLWNNQTTFPTLKISQPGIYWLKVSEGGCQNTDTIKVSYKPSPVVSLGKDTGLCVGQTLLLNAVNPGNSKYLWQDGSLQPDYSVHVAGKYSVNVNIDGCDTTAEIVINYFNRPVVSLGNDTTLCITQQLKLTASYPGSTIEWQDGTTGENYTVTMAGRYVVAATNICGITKDSIKVEFENCACKWSIPNAFTPNHDGNNDLFMPGNSCLFSNYSFVIYDRWGKRIFLSSDAKKGWDGTINGRSQPSGTYVWIMEYTDTLTGKHEKKSGTVILLY